MLPSRSWLLEPTSRSRTSAATGHLILPRTEVLICGASYCGLIGAPKPHPTDWLPRTALTLPQALTAPAAISALDGHPKDLARRDIGLPARLVESRDGVL